MLTQLNLKDFEDLWKIQFPKEICNLYEGWSLDYRRLGNDEFQSLILTVITELKKDLTKAGPHRQLDWQLGWSRNLEDFLERKDLNALRPGYFEKSSIMRVKQQYVLPSRSGAEPEVLQLIVRAFALEYLTDCEVIFEFGCGTGNNIVSLLKLFPDKNFVGLDWAESSQEIIKRLSEVFPNNKIRGHRFDFFQPDDTLELGKNSGILTVAALEQVGGNYRSFVDFILRKGTKVVLHIEPIEELLDDNNLLDYLSLEYFRKRNYLTGYLNYLKSLEDQGKLRIIEAKRSYIGSLYIDGYSVIAWTPI